MDNITKVFFSRTTDIINLAVNLRHDIEDKNNKKALLHLAKKLLDVANETLDVYDWQYNS